MRGLAPTLCALATASLLGTGCPPRHTYPDGRGITGQLEREVVALQQKTRLLEDQVAMCDVGGPPDPFFSEAVQIFHDAEVDINRRGSSTVLTIPGHYLFTPDSRVREEATKVLDLLGMALSLHPKHNVVVEGHVSERTTKSAGRPVDAWTLSYERAHLVQQELTYKYGVTEKRFSVSARGDAHPVASNDTTGGQAANERIVVVVSPPLHED